MRPRALSLILLALPMGAAPPAYIQTSAAGDRLRALPPVRLRPGRPRCATILEVDATRPRQTLEGVGGALTESSSFVLAGLPRAERDRVLDLFFGPGGAGFTMARIPVGACDFSVHGRFSYDDAPGDTALEHFSIAPDLKGQPGTLDPDYGLIALIRDARKREPGLKLLASPWSAPAWMKDNQAWYGKGRGGSLLPEHVRTFARYMARYLLAYRAQGIPVWGITPENEPVGNGGQWESMEFTPEAMARYLKELGPELAGQGLGDVKILQYDHNRDAWAMRFAQALEKDPDAARFVWGTALHWYERTDASNTTVLEELHALRPDKALLHSEGCIDAIASETNSPGGRFLGWKNDAWWWRPEATDWGFQWAVPEERAFHPRYAPAERYARDLIETLNHWAVAWIDWNIVLDRTGGPNHVGNLCAAPVMIDPATREVYRTPLLPVITHFSRYLHPGDQILPVTVLGPRPFLATAARSRDGRTLTLVAYNPGPDPRSFALQVGRRSVTLRIPGRALQTLQVPLVRTTARR